MYACRCWRIFIRLTYLITMHEHKLHCARWVLAAMSRRRRNTVGTSMFLDLTETLLLLDCQTSRILNRYQTSALKVKRRTITSLLVAWPRTARCSAGSETISNLVKSCNRLAIWCLITVYAVDPGARPRRPGLQLPSLLRWGCKS